MIFTITKPHTPLERRNAHLCRFRATTSLERAPPKLHFCQIKRLKPYPWSIRTLSARGRCRGHHARAAAKGDDGTHHGPASVPRGVEFAKDTWTLDECTYAAPGVQTLASTSPPARITGRRSNPPPWRTAHPASKWAIACTVTAAHARDKCPQTRYAPLVVTDQKGQRSAQPGSKVHATRWPIRYVYRSAKKLPVENQLLFRRSHRW